jgi:aspartate ammonia-lyase
MLSRHAEGIEADETECERQFNTSLEIITAFLPAIGYDKATELVQMYKNRKDPMEFRTFLENELGAERVEKTLSPQNLMAMGHKK